MKPLSLLILFLGGALLGGAHPQPDQVGGAGAEVAGRAVGQVAELRYGLLDAQQGVLAQQVGVVRAEVASTGGQSDKSVGAVNNTVEEDSKPEEVEQEPPIVPGYAYMAACRLESAHLIRFGTSQHCQISQQKAS